MKKYLYLFVALALSVIGMLAPQGLSAQQRPVKVQGHPHEVLTRLHAEGKWQYPQPSVLQTSTDSIRLEDILFWVGNPSSRQIDSAALVIKWTDGKQVDNILIWGYRWDRANRATSIDMLRAIAAADQRMTILIQNTGISPATEDTLNYAIGGLGYNYAAKVRIPLLFDYNGAKQDGNILFHYVAPPNTAMHQTSCPDDPVGDADAAIANADVTGIIEHPFNYPTYGYPAYDYDHWQLTNPDDQTHSWQAGWYRGYWSFYVKDQLIGQFGYSDSGASQRVLQNHSVDGWVYASWSADMSGDYTPAEE
ncbi:MAG: hypothetical protein LBQ39_07935 [Tannerellaceae bacterium]|nr:hypothetical protein [Tannerellaceae bacterium]